ncbi:hypothetical protein ACOSQ3_022954 [Xanthoceras sorbifolium]
MEEDLDLEKENHACRLEKIWNGEKKKKVKLDLHQEHNPKKKKKIFLVNQICSNNGSRYAPVDEALLPLMEQI